MKTFNLPDLGEGLAEAEIVRWHVNSGDHVNVDDPMLAVETAKAIVEVPSPFSGVIRATHGQPGDRVATGTLLVEFEADAATDSGTVVGRMPGSDEDFLADLHDNPGSGFAENNPAAPQPAHLRAIPAARALAKRLGMDLTRIRGTGPGLLVTVDDVLRASPANPPRGATEVPRRQPVEPPAAPANGPASVAPGGAEPLRGLRRAMAQSMALARDNVVGCTLFDDADLHEWRDEQDVTTRLLRAIAAGCAAEPGLNAWFDGNDQTRHVLSHVDVAIAVDTPEGLMAPVIRNIAERSVAQLRDEVDLLKRAALERTVKPEQLRDFTFMLSNFGIIAGRYATPIVVPPAVAILGAGRLEHTVVATGGGAIETHLRMPLSLTFDHRCVTGGEAARFAAAVIRDLQKGS